MLPQRNFWVSFSAGLALGVILVFAAAPAGFAQSDFSTGIVPRCNTNWNAEAARFNDPCTLCHLFELSSNVINFFVRLIMFPAASILIIVGGGFMLTSASSGRYKTGKEIITKAIWGIVIVLVAYVLVMTILWVLLPDPTGENTRKSFRIGVGGFEIQCTPAERISPDRETRPSSEQPRPPRVGALPDTPVVAVSRWCPGTVEERRSRLCQRISEATPGATVAQCLTAIQATRSQSKLLLAILEKESGGFPDRENNVYNISEGREILSCGVGQISTATAQRGISMGISGIPRIAGRQATPQEDRAVCDWLKTHPLESIRIADQVLFDRGNEAMTISGTQRYALSEIEIRAAAYNGGPIANNPSRNCTPTQTPETCQVTAGPVPRWACSFDRPADGSCQPNVGYAVTRDYVAVVYACYTKP